MFKIFFLYSFLPLYAYIRKKESAHQTFSSKKSKAFFFSELNKQAQRNPTDFRLQRYIFL